MAGLTQEELQQLTPEDVKILFPDLPDKDVQSIVAGARGRSELRRQPTALEAATSPGGIASPENVGIVGGGILGMMKGGMVGAPLGPAGAAAGGVLGGLLGAGIGAIGGRGIELGRQELERRGVVEPIPRAGTVPEVPPTLRRQRQVGEIVDDLAQAGNRGLIAESIGQLTGGIVGRVVGGSPLARTRTAQELKELSHSLDIPLTSAEVKGSSKTAILESVPGRFPLGVAPMHRFLKMRASKIEQAALKFADETSPGSTKDYIDIGNTIKDLTERKVERLANLTKGVIDDIGKPVGLRQAGEGVLSAKEKLYANAQAKARKLYDLADAKFRSTLGNDAVDNVPAPSFMRAAQDLVERSKGLKGVTTRPENIAGGIAEQPSAVQIGGVSTSIDDLPTQLVQQLGLDEPKSYSLQSLRDWQTRLTEMAVGSTNRNVRREFVQLIKAVDQDIQRFAEDAPQAKVLLDRARDFYKAQVANIYLNPKVIRNLNAKDADAIASFIIKPRGSVIPIVRLKRAVDERTFNNLAASYFDDIATRSSPGGVFDPKAFTRAVNAHRPEILRTLLGPRADEVTALTKVLTKSNRLLRFVGTPEGDQLLAKFIRPNGTVNNLARLKKEMTPQQFDDFASVWLKDLVTNKSLDNAGNFSPMGFLQHFTGKNKYTTEQLVTLFGRERAAQFKGFVNLLSRIAETRGGGLNPSETARGLLSHGQIIGGIYLAGQATAAALEGDLFDRRTMTSLATQGLILMTPAIMAQMLYRPGGIRLLTRAIQMKPGTAAAVKTAGEIAALLAIPQKPLQEVTE